MRGLPSGDGSYGRKCEGGRVKCERSGGSWQYAVQSWRLAVVGRSHGRGGRGWMRGLPSGDGSYGRKCEV